MVLCCKMNCDINNLRMKLIVWDVLVCSRLRFGQCPVPSCSKGPPTGLDLGRHSYLMIWWRVRPNRQTTLKIHRTSISNFVVVHSPAGIVPTAARVRFGTTCCVLRERNRHRDYFALYTRPKDKIMAALKIFEYACGTKFPLCGCTRHNVLLGIATHYMYEARR